jgi:hypothetical protein
MKFLDSLLGRYQGHPEAVIISCFFNPMNSPYRLAAFKRFYHSIKHLNHSIVECVIGDAAPQLEESENIQRMRTQTLLWHKESILNQIVAKLPPRFRFVFWIDADVLFQNKRWLVEGVAQLQRCNIIQAFEYCVHLNRDETEPAFKVDQFRGTVSYPRQRHPQLWRGFCANHVTNRLSADENYDRHGHVGFAWGARREVLANVPLYDRALIGGADHIMAHAAAGQIPHPCIAKSFTEDLESVLAWSNRFHSAVKGKIGYVKGDLYHLWHGDINKRQYLKRIQEFTSRTKAIQERDEHGLHVAHAEDEAYVRKYFREREVTDADIFILLAFDQASAPPMMEAAAATDYSGATANAEVPAAAEASGDAAGTPDVPPPILLENEETPAAAGAPVDGGNFS